MSLQKHIEKVSPPTNIDIENCSLNKMPQTRLASVTCVSLFTAPDHTPVSEDSFSTNPFRAVGRINKNSIKPSLHRFSDDKLCSTAQI